MKDILLVDDDTELRSALSELLEEHGYIVRTAPDGFAALALIRCREPHLLLSDLDMPRMSGFELLSIVRRRFPTIAVIAMSGMSMPSGIAADAFYAKGATSIFNLIEIFHSIADEEARRLQRAAAPVWVHGTPIYSNDRSKAAVACPECLRLFWHPVQWNLMLQFGSHCPHCFHPIQIAIVKQSEAFDIVDRGLSASENMVLRRAGAD